MSFFLVWDLCIAKPYRMSKKSTEKPQDECPGIGGCITFLRCPARSWQWKILRRNDPPITALDSLGCLIDLANKFRTFLAQKIPLSGLGFRMKNGFPFSRNWNFFFRAICLQFLLLI